MLWLCCRMCNFCPRSFPGFSGGCGFGRMHVGVSLVERGLVRLSWLIELFRYGLPGIVENKVVVSGMRRDA